MDELIEALQIFRKYGNKQRPTHCEHDVLCVVGIDVVSDEDANKLNLLGFHWSAEYDSWVSFRFGSA